MFVSDLLKAFLKHIETKSANAIEAIYPICLADVVFLLRCNAVQKFLNIFLNMDC